MYTGNSSADYVSSRVALPLVRRRVFASMVATFTKAGKTFVNTIDRHQLSHANFSEKIAKRTESAEIDVG